jgi:aspartyl-tRNA(Asn)/glutamyl-tRNA(Gln) amidotransferase subunit A
MLRIKKKECSRYLKLFKEERVVELNKLTIHELQALLAKKEISSLELTEKCLEQVENINEQNQAFITVTKEKALKAAQAVDEKRDRGEELSPLAGIPVALKDNICTEGITTSCGSKILHNFVPPYNAYVVERICEAEGIVLGKTNMDEFSLETTTSREGSGVAVANGVSVYALGSDTGGSLRRTAVANGLVGLKPTYGLVSRNGLVAYASSLDQIGPITKDVTDSALVLNTIAGHDAKDSTSLKIEYPDYTQFLKNDVQGLRIGLPQEYFNNENSALVDKIKEVAQKLEELGAIVEECSLPHTEYAQGVYEIIATAEASSNLARYDGVRYGYRAAGAQDVDTLFVKTRSEGFGPEAKDKIILGTYILSSDSYEEIYLKALKIRSLIKQDFEQAFSKYDCLLTPPVYTNPVNLAGIPALTMTCGLIDNQPVGLQLIGKELAEGTLLRIAYSIEQNTDQTRLKASL